MPSDLKELIAKIKPFLRQYLQMSGVTIRADGKFICPSPDKHDTDPSAGFVPGTNDTVARCFGCSRSFDLLTAAHWREGLPLRGKAFVHKTVYALARRFGVAFTPQEMSDKDVEIMHLQRIYEDAFNALRGFWENRHHIEKRGWSQNLCYEMGVATVTSWGDFLSRLQGLRDYSKAELDRAGIKPAYFNENGVTFTLFDEYGSPVGFAVRDMRFGKVDGVTKYLNTHSTLLYDKSSLVYGLHRARQASGPMNIVEGYADVMSAFTFGIWNTGAVCGAKPTPSQVNRLEEAGKRDITLAMDHDIKPMNDGRPTGQGRTEDFLNEYVKGRRGIRVRVVDWAATSPNGKMDLDTFLMGLHQKGLSKEEVVRAWDNVPKRDSFAWQLGILKPGLPADAVVERMLPIVAAEPLSSRQEMLLRELYKHTVDMDCPIRLEALQRDLDALLDLRAKETRDQIARVTRRAYEEAQMATPEEAAQILRAAEAKVTGIVNSAGKGQLDAGSSLDRAQEVLTAAEGRSADMVGLKTGFPVFDKYMSGFCPGVWIWGGFANSGKCVPANALVHTKRGRIPASDVVAGDIVVGYAKGKLQYGTVTAAWDNGPREILEIVTTSGRKFRGSGNHPLRKLREWARADTLREGDYVAVADSVDANKEQDELVYALSALVGDGYLGSTTSASSVQFSNQTAELCAATIEGVKTAVPGAVLHLNGKTNHRIIDTLRVGRKSGVRVLLEREGIFGLRSHEKFIPTSWEHHPVSVLSGLWDTDGSVYVSSVGYIVCAYCSASEKLARGVLHLLGKVGVFAKIRFKPNDKLGAWLVEIMDRQSVMKFRDVIRLKHPGKHALLQQAGALRPSGACRSEHLPPEARNMVKEAYKSSDRNWVDLGRRLNRDIPKGTCSIASPANKRSCLMRSVAEAAGEVFECAELSVLSSERRVWWDRIVSIKKVGIEPTIDLQVAHIESFVVDGFVTHNSSSVAMMSYNAACLNPDSVNLVMTLDDSLEEWMAKYIALQTGIPIGHVAHVERWIKPYPEKMELYIQARNNVLKLMSEGRLEVRDASMGTNTAALERWVDQVRKRNPDKKMAVWLDNFHCLTDSGADPRIRYSIASKKIQLLAKTRRCFIGMTAELRKSMDRGRPTKDLLKETGTLEYDATGVIMVHCPLDVDPETSDAWDDPNASDPALRRKPILYWYIDKNKNLYGVYKGVVRLRFDNECSRINQLEIPTPGYNSSTPQAPPSASRWKE